MRTRIFSFAASIALAIAPVVSFAQNDAGAYLSGRQAASHHDFVSAARFYANAMLTDPTNPDLMENTVAALMALGQIERADPVAQQMMRLGQGSQLSNLALILAKVQDRDWSGVLETQDQGASVGPLVDALVQAWALLGSGRIDEALTAFDDVARTDGMGAYGLTHKAYALASLARFEEAAAVFATEGLRLDRQSAVAYAQILGQLGQRTEALAVLDAVFGRQKDQSIAALYQTLTTDAPVAYTAVSDPAAGLSELLFAIAMLVDGEAQDAFTLIYARAASVVSPDNTRAVLMTADLLSRLGQLDLANTAYTTIDRDDPAYLMAELGRSDVLRDAGRLDAAIEVLDALSRSYPENPDVITAKADGLRAAERWTDAVDAYTRALDIYDDTSETRWFVHYARAVSYHRLDDWAPAEDDFRRALDLRPDHPQILNYLGYSLVERGEKLDEALAMIETAAAARPDNGAIIDSLGWVYFQLGRFEEAVIHLEHAASLEPVDPVINDHLGDAFWAVGREIEARFQWNRALSFNPTEENAARIRDKLTRGLDLVLLDEGRAPVRVASGNR